MTNEEIFKNVSTKDISGEEWQDVVGYEGLYLVSNLGRVKSLNYRRAGKAKILKFTKRIDGYLQVRLCKNEKNTYLRVHRLVASAFIPNQYNLSQVNHKDENKENNRADNLEWCTAEYNTNYGTRNERISKNHGRSKKVLCVDTGVIYPSSLEAERCTRADYRRIIECCQGKRKTACGYHWKYAD